MSDRATTQLKFNELLALYRSEVLPVMIEDWGNLDADVQNKLTQMNKFFCGLHGLVHMAETSNKSSKEVEDLHFDGNSNIPILNPRFRKPFVIHSPM